MLFTRDAVIAIHEHSRGIPRVTSVLCDNALVSGFAADQKPVGRELVLEVCRDFHLQRAQAPAVPRKAANMPSPASVADDPRPAAAGVNRPRRFSFF
jgi:hypothetical protein